MAAADLFIYFNSHLFVKKRQLFYQCVQLSKQPSARQELASVTQPARGPRRPRAHPAALSQCGHWRARLSRLSEPTPRVRAPHSNLQIITYKTFSVHTQLIYHSNSTISNNGWILKTYLLGASGVCVWQTQRPMDGWIFFFLSNYVSNSRYDSTLRCSHTPFSLCIYSLSSKLPKRFSPAAAGTWNRCESSQPSVRAIQAQSLPPCDQVMLHKCWLKPSNTSYQFILLPKAQWLKGSVSIWSLLWQDTCEIIAELMMDNSSHTTDLH